MHWLDIMLLKWLSFNTDTNSTYQAIIITLIISPEIFEKISD